MSWQPREFELMPQQKKAVDHIEGPILAVAGAGTGKTTVLACRVVRLIEDKLADPTEVLAVTYTRNSARDLLKRITRLPLQRRDLIEETIVAEQAVWIFLGERRICKKSEAPHTIVEADEHHTALGEVRPVVDRGRASAVDEPAAIDPHHDGQLAGRPLDGRPHVEVQAVLGGLGAERRGVAWKRKLHAIGCIGGGGSHTLPLRDGLRRAPAILACGRRGVRNALERDHAARDRSFQRAAFDAHLVDGSGGGTASDGRKKNDAVNSNHVCVSPYAQMRAGAGRGMRRRPG